MDTENTIRAVGADRCTGCAACANICPAGAINMKYDEEGFVFPIIDTKKCVNCGKCLQICPAVSFSFSNDSEPSCYAVWAADKVRKVSSSGGIFTVLATYFLKKGGIVFGAEWSPDYRTVRHTYITKISELDRLRRSKYLQSEIGTSYSDCKRFLNEGKTVLFTGTPCQIAGLTNFLEKHYDNLYTIDIVCHSVPSRKAYLAYVADREKEASSHMTSINFRDKKKYGWRPSILMTFENGKTYTNKIGSCTFYRGFIRGIINRKSCASCKFASIPRPGDLTLADFWGIQKYNADYDDCQGTSCLLVNNDRFNSIFKKIKFRLFENVPLQFAKDNNGQLVYPLKSHPGRQYFFDSLDNIGYDAAIRKTWSEYNPPAKPTVPKFEYDFGIVGWWYGTNYGSSFTYYALHSILQDMGYRVLMIDQPLPYPDAPSAPRETISRKFAKKHYTISDRYPFKELRTLNRKCKAFILGSDQIFNSQCICGEEPFYLLDFVADDKKKIAFATSFGHSKLLMPQNERQLFSYRLSRFNYLSVRELDGVDCCRTLGLKATFCLDPVFLCDNKHYLELAAQSDKTETGYILMYILDVSPDIRRLVLFLQSALKKKVLVILDGQSNYTENFRTLDLPDNIANIQAIEDWHYYFANADMIVTDSFHGTCLAIIHRKNFFTLINKRRGVARLNTLRQVLGIDDRIFSTPQKLIENDIIYQNIDYGQIVTKLENEKQHSLLWLKTALTTDTPSPADSAARIQAHQSSRNKKKSNRSFLYIVADVFFPIGTKRREKLKKFLGIK